MYNDLNIMKGMACQCKVNKGWFCLIHCKGVSEGRFTALHHPTDQSPDRIRPTSNTLFQECLTSLILVEIILKLCPYFAVY